MSNQNQKQREYNDARRNDAKRQRRIAQARKRRKKQLHVMSKIIGLMLSIIQLLASGVLVGAVIKLNMLPTKFLLIAVGVLFVLWGTIFTIQLMAKRRAIISKFVSVFLTVIIIFGTIYIFDADSAVKDVAGADVKIDSMVVAVLVDDSAESIEDALDYEFGVQYSLRGTDVVETINQIEAEEGVTLAIEEYDDISTQVRALRNGDVDAIIYNEAYVTAQEEAFPDFHSEVKVIYEYGIESALDLGESYVAVETDPFIVYLSGIDVKGDITQNSRSDTNILAVVNPTTHKVLLVTTPRDYHITIPGVTSGQKDKLTHAGLYGVDASIAALENLYDVDVDFYGRLNFTSFVDVIDALGGITVNSEFEFSSHYTLTGEQTLEEVHFVVGPNELDGSSALAFARERKSFTNGDVQRGIHQQEVIRATIEKATSPSVITKVSQLIESVSGNVDTSMSVEQIQTLIKNQIAEGAVWDIESISATGYDDRKVCYSSGSSAYSVITPDYDSVDEISEKIQEVLDGVDTSEDEVDSDTIGNNEEDTSQVIIEN